MKYHVHRNDHGAAFDAATFSNLPDAIAHAARLARVTTKTIQRRMQKRPYSGGVQEVSGRETGDQGVWIEFEGED